MGFWTSQKTHEEGPISPRKRPPETEKENKNGTEIHPNPTNSGRISPSTSIKSPTTLFGATKFELMVLGELYIKFVRNNQETVRLMEDLMQTIVFLLPSRYTEGRAELLSEAGYAISNLLAFFHDTILNPSIPVELKNNLSKSGRNLDYKTSDSKEQSVQESLQETDSKMLERFRYGLLTMTIAEDNQVGTPKGIQRIRILLTLISYIEVLIEKWQRRRMVLSLYSKHRTSGKLGDESDYSEELELNKVDEELYGAVSGLMVVLELIKAVARITLLAMNNHENFPKELEDEKKKDEEGELDVLDCNFKDGAILRGNNLLIDGGRYVTNIAAIDKSKNLRTLSQQERKKKLETVQSSQQIQQRRLSGIEKTSYDVDISVDKLKYQNDSGAYQSMQGKLPPTIDINNTKFSNNNDAQSIQPKQNHVGRRTGRRFPIPSMKETRPSLLHEEFNTCNRAIANSSTESILTLDNKETYKIQKQIDKTSTAEDSFHNENNNHRHRHIDIEQMGQSEEKHGHPTPHVDTNIRPGAIHQQQVLADTEINFSTCSNQFQNKYGMPHANSASISLSSQNFDQQVSSEKNSYNLEKKITLKNKDLVWIKRRRLAGELLHILRPLVYTYLLWRNRKFHAEKEKSKNLSTIDINSSISSNKNSSISEKEKIGNTGLNSVLKILQIFGFGFFIPSSLKYNSTHSSTRGSTEEKRRGELFAFFISFLMDIISLELTEGKMIANCRQFVMRSSRSISLLEKPKNTSSLERNESRRGSSTPTSRKQLIQYAGESSMSPIAFNIQEKQEIQRRKALLLLYFFRSPLYEISLKQLAKACQSMGGNIPLVGGMVNYLVRALTYIQKHHHYTLGS